MRLSTLLPAIGLFPYASFVRAFDAGITPPEAYVKDGRAFRHGDIEQVFTDLAASGEIPDWEFWEEDQKRLYFGNWLRDYSQGVDISSLRFVNKDVIVAFIVVHGYVAMGYAGEDYHITEDTLGVYRPEEHIDNPTGYGGGKDPRRYDHRLRGPVSPEEVAIDLHTGMKNYIHNENGGWATSTAHIKDLVRDSVTKARAYLETGQRNLRADAYRQLGSALHTLEDFMAHSNWLELCLHEFGYEQVFPHVGENTQLVLGGHYAYPLVTGTFGSKDATNSLLQGMIDSLTQLSKTNLNDEIRKSVALEPEEAQELSRDISTKPKDDKLGSIKRIKGLMNDVVSNQAACSMDAGIRASGTVFQRGSKKADCQPLDFSDEYWKFAESFDAEKFAKEVDTPEGEVDAESDLPELPLQRRQNAKRRLGLFRRWRARRLRKKLEDVIRLQLEVEKKVGHLTKDHGELHEHHTTKQLEGNVHIWIRRHLQPLLKPLLRVATKELTKLANHLISEDPTQYNVFVDPTSTDPTHSSLSKDHFATILNEPAGRIAEVISAHVLRRVITAWGDPTIDVEDVATAAIEPIFHPAMSDPRSEIQQRMMTGFHNWFQGHSEQNQAEILRRLGRDLVRDHENHRFDGLEEPAWHWGPEMD